MPDYHAAAEMGVELAHANLEEDVDEEDEEGEVVTIDFGEKPSTVEQLERLTGS